MQPPVNLLLVICNADRQGAGHIRHSDRNQSHVRPACALVRASAPVPVEVVVQRAYQKETCCLFVTLVTYNKPAPIIVLDAKSLWEEESEQAFQNLSTMHTRLWKKKKFGHSSAFARNFLTSFDFFPLVIFTKSGLLKANYFLSVW